MKKKLKKFEKRPLPDINYNITGDLVIGKVNLAESTHLLRQQSSRASLTSIGSASSGKKEAPVNQLMHSKSSAPLAPTSHPVTNVQVMNNGDTLSRWILAASSKPQSEVTISSAPLFLTSYANLLFYVDQTSYLSIYERIFNVELKLKNSVKLNMPGITR